MNALRKCWCRTYQRVMYVAEFMMPWRKAEVIEGPDSLLRLPALLKERKAAGVLVVTDEFLSKNVLPPFLAKMEEEGVKYALYDKVVPNPSIQCIEDGLKVYQANQCDVVVAVGGGSPMDCAKIIAARSVSKKSVEQMKGLLKINKKLPPFYAVPTTAGTGSEVTLAAVISNPDKNEKYPINDPSLIPGYVVLDPNLTVGLPPHITSTTGMDALTHAVEAYIGRSNTRDTKRDAVDAVKLIFDNILTAYHEGTNLEARGNMQRAAMLAGRAFTRAYVGYVHAIGHALGAFYHIPHGLAMSIILPTMLKAYGKSAYKRLAELADVVGIGGKDDQAKAEAFIARVEAMNAEMQIPQKIGGKFAINEADIPEIVKRADAEANPLYPCPTLFDKDELSAIVFELMEEVKPQEA